MKKLFLVFGLALLLSGCIHGPLAYEGKTAEQWQEEFVRMETKYKAIKGDYDGLNECLAAIESRFLKSSGATVAEITGCLDEYGG